MAHYLLCKTQPGCDWRKLDWELNQSTQKHVKLKVLLWSYCCVYECSHLFPEPSSHSGFAELVIWQEIRSVSGLWGHCWRSTGWAEPSADSSGSTAPVHKLALWHFKWTGEKQKHGHINGMKCIRVHEKDALEFWCISQKYEEKKDQVRRSQF